MLIVNVKQALLTAFNLQNKVKPPVSMNDINWSTPEVFIQGQCNTRIRMVARSSSNSFGGEQTLYYVRRRLSEELRGIKVPGKSSDYARFYDVLAVLRDTMGVPVFDNEFLDRTITGPTVTITTTVSSVAYLPADQITLEYAET